MDRGTVRTVSALAIFLLLMSALATTTVTATIYDQWQGAVPLEAFSPDASSSSPTVQFDRFGRGVAAWNWTYNNISHVRASYYDPSSGWSEPVVLDREGAVLASVAGIDDQGNAVVAWTTQVDGRQEIFGCARPADNGWGEPLRLSDLGYEDVTGLTVVVRSVAQFMIVGAARNGNDTSVLLSNYRTRTGFDPQAAVLVNVTGRVAGLYATSNGQGDSWLVWDRTDGSATVVEGISYYARFWSPAPVEIAPYATSPVVIMDEDGGALVAYRPVTTERAVSEVRTYRDGRWQSPTVLFDLDGAIAQFEMVSNPGGNITAAVLLVNSTSPPMMAFEHNGTVWTAGVPVTGPDEPIASFRLAMGVLGDAMIVFQGPLEENAGLHRFSFATRPEGGNWTEAEGVEAMGGGTPLPSFVLSATRTDYWLVFARTETGIAGESRTWADRFQGIVRGGAELRIDSYGINGTVSRPYIEIAGQVEPFSQVTVGDDTVSADRYGHFSVFVPLQEGKNTFTVSTVDSLGREARVTVSITYQPEEGSLLWVAVVGIGLAVGIAAVTGAYLVIRKKRRTPP